VRRRRSPGGRVVLAILGALGVLVGCAPADDTSTPPGEFVGPWAAVFAEYDALTDVEFGHAAFADSRLTDAEVQEGRALIDECYASFGYAVEYDVHGYETVTSLDGGDDELGVMNVCAFADGGVVALHDQIRLNPRNEDPMVLAASCMVAAGLVEPGFTAADLEAAFDGEAVPGWGTPASIACLRDPLGRATQ
jgi:hypothetical protein